MDFWTKILLVGSLTQGMTLLYLSIYVLHTYETKTGQKPPSLQFWPFNEETKKVFPVLSKLGRYLQFSTAVCMLLYFAQITTI